MSLIDHFTERRLLKFITDHRAKTGELPTLQDFAQNGISKEVVKSAVKAGLIEERYVTLTTGTVMKGYVLKV